MPRDVSADQVREWIDDELVEEVDQMPDEAAEFNYTVQMSGLLIHVIKRRPGGPLLVGQEIEFSEEIRQRIRSMSEPDRGTLVSKIREVLMDVPVVYGFRDEHDANVAFEDMMRIFVEQRIYPDEANQQELMHALVGVWKVLRYLDDIWTLIGSVDGRA